MAPREEGNWTYTLHLLKEGEPIALSTAADLVKAPLLYKGKVRELYDLGEHFLIVVTDRISAFDYVLDPAVPARKETY